MGASRRFYRRQFLNRARFHSSAHLIADIELDGDACYGRVSASLRVADCSRHVELDFDYSRGDSKAERANALRKAHLLAETTAAFAAALQAAYDELDATPGDASRPATSEAQAS